MIGGKYPVVTGLEHDEMGHPTGRPVLHMEMTAKRRRKLKQLAEEIPSLETEDQIGLHYALGKVFGDCGDYEQSARHLLQGNSLKRQHIIYDEPKTFERFEQPERMHDRKIGGRHIFALSRFLL